MFYCLNQTRYKHDLVFYDRLDSQNFKPIFRLILMEKCKKSSGLHWDIVLLCLLNVPATLFGGPWMCVAQVRAVTHLSALTVMSTNHAPGESPKVVEVKG